MATSSEQVEQGEMLLREEPSRPPLPSWAVEEPSEPMLTQEELDHIAYIEKLVEETSRAVEPPPRPAPPAVAAVPAEEQRPAQFEAEEVVHPRYADEFEREESRESEPTSGADQLETSDVGSPVPLYERTSPLLEEDEKHAMATSSEQVEQGEMLLREEPSRPPLPSWAVEEPSEPMLTQKELDKIGSNRSLAEVTVEVEPSYSAAPASGSGVADSAKCGEQLKPEGCALVEQQISFNTLTDLAWLEALVFCEVDTEESPQNEELQQTAVKGGVSPFDIECLREGVEQIVSYNRENSDKPSLSPLREEMPLSTDSLPSTIGYSFRVVEEKEEPIYMDREEFHETTKLSKTSEPAYMTRTEEQAYWNSIWAADRTKKEITHIKQTMPQLSTETFLDQHQKDELAITQRQPSMALTSWTPEKTDTSVEAQQPLESTLTQDQLIHIAHTQKLAEQRSFAAEPASEPKDAEASRPSEPTLTQEELDHIAYIQKLAEETSFAAEPLAQPTSEVKDAEAPRPSEPTLTQEELDHIAYIQRLAEETSFAAEPLAQPTSEVKDAEAPRPSEPTLTQEELDHIAYIQKLAEETSFAAEPLAQPTSEVKDAEAPRPSEPTLTQEELDHIAYIQRLAEETSLAVQPPPRPAPPSAILDEQRRASHDVEEADIPRYAAELESEEESEPTSGADQGVISDTGSPPLLYERESPLLDREEKPSPVAFEAQFGGEEIAEFQQQSRPLPSWTADEADFLISEEAPAPSEPTLTQEELDHIAYIQKLAEETSFAAEPLAQPTSEVKDAEAPRPSEPTLTQEELDHIAYIQRLAEETSFAAEPLAQPTSERLAEETSLAVQPPPRPAPPSAIPDEQRRASHDVEEADIPRYAAELESEEESEPTSGADQGAVSDTGSPPLLYERESPLLDREEKPSPVAFEAQFGGEEIAEFQQQSRPLPSWTADEADFLISEEAPAPSEPTLTQEELDHIAYIQKLAEETSFAAEPLAQPTSEVKDAEAPRPSEPTLTQEELDHIAYIQRLAEETSFAAEPLAHPTSEKKHHSQFSHLLVQRLLP
ncbi:hypothetical protein V3C99_006655, partial [Haemonchus contortus]